MNRRIETYVGAVLFCIGMAVILFLPVWAATQADAVRKAQHETATKVAVVAANQKAADDRADALATKVVDLGNAIETNKKTADDRADALDTKVADLGNDSETNKKAADDRADALATKVVDLGNAIETNKEAADDRADALAKTQDQSSIDAVSIYRDVKESVCAVLSTHSALPLGTCFLYRDNTHVRTVAHLFEDVEFSSVRVRFGTGEPITVRIVARDDAEDLVLLKLDKAQEGRKPLLLADDVNPGEWVVAFGQLYGRFLDSMRVAMISGLHRDSNDPRFFRDCPTCTDSVQIDNYTDAGASGGPVVNSKRKVVGIVRGGIGDVTLLTSADTIRRSDASVKWDTDVDSK